jgi:hypothetical protein
MATIHLKLVDNTSRNIEIGSGGNEGRDFQNFLEAKGHFSAPPGWVKADAGYLRLDAIIHAELRT